MHQGGRRSNPRAPVEELVDLLLERDERSRRREIMRMLDGNRSVGRLGRRRSQRDLDALTPNPAWRIVIRAGGQRKRTVQTAHRPSSRALSMTRSPSETATVSGRMPVGPMRIRAENRASRRYGRSDRCVLASARASAASRSASALSSSAHCVASRARASRSARAMLPARPAVHP